MPPGGGLWWWGVEVSLLTSDDGAPDGDCPPMSRIDFYITSHQFLLLAFPHCHNL